MLAHLFCMATDRNTPENKEDKRSRLYVFAILGLIVSFILIFLLLSPGGRRSSKADLSTPPRTLAEPLTRA